GDEVYIKTGGGQYFQAVDGGGGDLNATARRPLDWETFRIVRAAGAGVIKSGDVVGLQTVRSGNWVSAENGGGGRVFAYGPALGPWERLVISLAGDTPVSPPPVGGGGGGPGAKADFGPNVHIFDPSMPMSAIQSTLNSI